MKDLSMWDLLALAGVFTVTEKRQRGKRSAGVRNLYLNVGLTFTSCVPSASYSLSFTWLIGKMRIKIPSQSYC